MDHMQAGQTQAGQALDASEPAPMSSGVEAATLGRQWLFKTLAFAAVLLGFGIWGLLDATIWYPRRGMLDASYQLKNWLEAAKGAGTLNATTLSVPDPKSALAELEKRESELRATAGNGTGASKAALADLAKLEWLRSLSRAWRLDADVKHLGESEKPTARSLYFDPKTGAGWAIEGSLGGGGKKIEFVPEALRENLVAKWNTSKQPSPLSAFDMAFQWVFVVLGLGGGAYLIVVLLRSKAEAGRYRFEHETQRLSLPSGANFAPSDVQEFDKRLWHKFFVVVNTKDGGKHKLDLLRFSPVEDWVLAIERTAFPESAKDSEPGADEGRDGTSQAAPAHANASEAGTPA